LLPILARGNDMTAFHKLTVADRQNYRDHLLRLSPQDRMMRFQGYIAEDLISAHVARIDFGATIVVGAFQAGRLVGAAELAMERLLLPRFAEIAVTVEDNVQGQGIGTELARRAVTIARNRGVRQLSMLCLAQNRRMQQIAKRLEAELAFAQGSVEASIALSGATPLSLLTEAFDDSNGTLKDFADRMMAAA